MGNQQILCIEDADDTLAILHSALNGYDLAVVKTVQEAIARLETDAFSLILLDIGLPDGSGLEVLAHLETASLNQQRPAVICLTGSSEFASKVAAFSLGVDDFIQKPFDPRELRLRVDAKLRKQRGEAESSENIRIGDLVCSIPEQRLRRNGEVIDLTSHEFRIFRLLARTPNKIFSRDEILTRVWSDSVSVTDRTVDVHVSNLRKKIRGSNVLIRTVVGAGYRVDVTPSVEISER